VTIPVELGGTPKGRSRWWRPPADYQRAPEIECLVTEIPDAHSPITSAIWRLTDTVHIKGLENCPPGVKVLQDEDLIVRQP